MDPKGAFVVLRSKKDWFGGLQAIPHGRGHQVLPIVAYQRLQAAGPTLVGPLWTTGSRPQCSSLLAMAEVDLINADGPARNVGGIQDRPVCLVFWVLEC